MARSVYCTGTYYTYTGLENQVTLIELSDSRVFTIDSNFDIAITHDSYILVSDTQPHIKNPLSYHISTFLTLYW